MAEKEERILIKKQINYHPPYGGWCVDGKEIVLTRSKAIERMAKAIYDEEIGRCNEEMCAGKECKDCFRWKKCEYVAEVALNALLSSGE